MLVAKIDLKPIRIPHDEVVPTVAPNILTVVTRDHRRALPVIRLTYIETIEKLRARMEREVRMERTDFSLNDVEVWQRLRQWANAKAWAHFQRR